MGKVGPRLESSSLHGPSNFPTYGLTIGGSVGFLTHQSMSALLHSGKTFSSRSFGVECVQPSVEVSGELCVSTPCINSVVQVVRGTCYKLIQTSYSGGAMLDGEFVASHSSQHFGRHYSLISHCKRSHQGCFRRFSTQGSAIAAFNPSLLNDMCCTDKGSLPQSVRQWQG